MRMSDWCSDVCASDLAAHRDQAVAGLQQAGHQLHQGRLAAAGRADHGDELAFLDIEGKVLDREGFLFGLAIDQIDAVDLDESRALHQAAPRCVRSRRLTPPAPPVTIPRMKIRPPAASRGHCRSPAGHRCALHTLTKIVNTGAAKL